MEKIEVLFLGIEGFEAFALAALQSAALRHCRASPVVAFIIQCVKNALRNEAKHRRISLTSTSICLDNFCLTRTITKKILE